MRIHTWTSGKGSERQLTCSIVVFIGCSTPVQPFMHFQKLKSDFPLRLPCGVFVARLCSSLPTKQSPLLLTPGVLEELVGESQAAKQSFSKKTEKKTSHTKLK